MKMFAIVVAASLMGSASFAENHTMSQMTGAVNEDNIENLIRSRDITGGTIYTLNEAYDEADWDAATGYDAVDASWEAIGEIEDVVLSRDGKMTGIIAEVGGFLDIGDAHVLIRLDDVRLVAVDDQTYAYVTRKSEEELENLPQVDEGWWN